MTDGLPEPSLTLTAGPTQAATQTATPDMFPLPTDTTPVLNPTLAYELTATPRNIAMTVEGPGEARPGETLTYRLVYQIQNVPGTDAVIAWSDDTVRYVSSRLTSGKGQIASEPVAAGLSLRWSLQGSGVLEIVLQVPQDHRGGEFRIGAYEPGTQTTSSNTVTTTIAP